ncbi:MAG: alanine racemase [Caldilineaceae bacterium]|nr:alanine racemase [Caldilineaceae bacterium]
MALTIFDLESAHALNRAAAELGEKALVHVKVNTGMNRLGIDPQEAVAFLTGLARQPSLDVEGIFTHFATSDEADTRFTLEQFARFSAVLDQLQHAGLRPRIAHAANSAAMLTLPQTHLDMVRCGIALYGLHPDADQCRLPAGFRPVLAWKAHIAQVRELKPGDAVSYGREFVARDSMLVATIPVGYADGFPRRPFHWGNVLVAGKAAPILGRVCMDQTIIDVTQIAAVAAPPRQGDEVVLIGRQGSLDLSAEEVGARLGTINYDVVSRILARVPRVTV